MNINPTFSIISVVYNNHDGLKKTINSIINQTYHDFEYIIVDGASTDGSREVAKQYEDVFANFGIDYKIISEPDNGIYDAMNKGIDISKGEWLLFLNSGDSLASSDVLSLCELFCESSIDVIYGGTKYKFKNLVKLSGGGYMNELPQGMVFCHQSAFISSKTIKIMKYDTRYKTAADYDFFLRCYSLGKKFEKIPIIVSEFEFGGVSTKGNYNILYEKALVQYNNGIFTKYEYDKEIKKLKYGEKMYNLRQIIKKSMPKKLRDSFIKHTYINKGFQMEND